MLSIFFVMVGLLISSALLRMWCAMVINSDGLATPWQLIKSMLEMHWFGFIGFIIQTLWAIWMVITRKQKDNLYGLFLESTVEPLITYTFLGYLPGVIGWWKRTCANYQG